MALIVRKTVKIAVESDRKMKTGRRGENGQPQKLDYFNVDKWPEVAEAYGDKPDKYVITLPANNILDIYSERFERWGAKEGASSTLLRECDGETCTHHFPSAFKGVNYAEKSKTPCICKALGWRDNETGKLVEGLTKEDKPCSFTMQLKAWIRHPMDGRPIGLNPVLFESGSDNTAGNVRACIEKLMFFTSMLLRGRVHLTDIPLKLWVKLVKSRKKPGQTFPVWYMEPVATSLTQLHDRLSAIAGYLADAELKEVLALPTPTAEVGDASFGIPEADFVDEAEEDVDQRPEEERRQIAATSTASADPFMDSSLGHLRKLRSQLSVAKSRLAVGAVDRERARMIGQGDLHKDHNQAIFTEIQEKLREFKE